MPSKSSESPRSRPIRPTATGAGPPTWAPSATGSGHSVDYVVQDYTQAVVNPAKAMAMTVIDLLYDDGQKAKELIDNHTPLFNKNSYLNFQNSRLTEERYIGE